MELENHMVLGAEPEHTSDNIAEMKIKAEAFDRITKSISEKMQDPLFELCITEICIKEINKVTEQLCVLGLAPAEVNCDNKATIEIQNTIPKKSGCK